MNRHQRRAAAAKAAQGGKPDRAELIRCVLAVLAASGPSATGATLILPDGEVLHLDVADARAMTGQAPARGHA